jgi:nucleotide-binding universal stress UspA family protein
VEATCQYVQAPKPEAAVLANARWFDLIVLGPPTGSRASGILIRETATSLLHRSPVPVLVTRAPELTGGVVVATRGVPQDRAALTAAAHIAARRGCELTEVRQPGGSPAHEIVTAAEDAQAGLIVLGSDLKHGLPAPQSVSERVAHQAPCSVLVMRGR